MNDKTKERLRLLDRALRPRAAAQRAQVDVAARGNDLVAEQRDLLARQVALLEEVRELASAAHVRIDAVEDLLLTVGAAVGAVDRRNVDYDRWTAEIIARTLGPGDTGIDVGAHSGLILQAIVAAAPEGRHLAFEPIPALAAGLRRDYPSVEVHEVALAEAEGEVEFHHVTSNPSYSGLREREYAGPEAVELIRVRAARLDDVLDPDLPVRLLKIDVEGGELGVLRGAPRLLGERRPVTVFEFGKGATGAYGTSAADIHGLFAGHGMAVSRLDAYLAGRPPLTLGELERHHETGDQYYFVAHPAPAS